MPVGLDRNKQVQRIVLRIDEVDIPSRAVHGYDKSNVLVVATFRETPNGILAVPAQNERWIAQREGMGQWRLIGRLDSADQQTWAETNLGPGDMRIEADNIWFTGTVHGITGGVTSFNTRTGAVTLLLSDVTGTGLSFSDVGALGATAAAGGDLTGNYPNPTIKTSVALSGNPTATTQLATDNSTRIATTAYVQSQGYLTSSTGVTSFNTRTGAVTLSKADVTGTGLSFSDVGALGATAAAGGDLTGNYPNPTIKSSVGLGGNPTTTTQTATDSSTKIATTAFVHAAIAADSVVITSSWSAGPPGSPSDGDIWIASGVDSNGVRWQFQYNAGSSSAYKWEFIGGPPIFVLGSGDNPSVTATSWTYDSTGPTWTPSRGGDYYVQVGMRTDGTEGQQSLYGLAQSGSPTPQVWVNVRDLTNWNDSMHAGIATGLTASSAFRAYIQNTGGTSAPARQFSRWASILPVRVS